MYEVFPVQHRDIVVTVLASGVVQPILTLSVKSKASGEIIGMPVQTGDEVKRGQLLARIDPRIPRSDLTQAQANLDVATAQLENATAQLKRSEQLYQSKSIAETDYESARLAYTNAKAASINSKANLQNAKDAMEDTQVRAPIAGTVLELDAVLGTVISSPTHDVGGGTVILKIANLDTVQVQAMVDETDIGKLQAGIPVTITVDAYPNLTFSGTVLKIEPQAQIQQNVTMFPVLVNIINRQHLLRPGMNSEVDIRVADRSGVLAIPNAALRTNSDVASAAQVLGMNVETVQRELAAQPVPSRDSARAAATSPADRDTAIRAAGMGMASKDGGARAASRADKDAGVAAANGSARSSADTAGRGETLTLPNGREITLPAGVRADQVRSAMRKRFSGETLTPAEQAVLRQVFAQRRGGRGADPSRSDGSNGGSARQDGGNGASSAQGNRGYGGGRGIGAGDGVTGFDQGSSPGRLARRGVFGGNYIVFARRQGKVTPVRIQTGVTDLDYIEVASGLTEQDSVLVLPTASLVQSQQEMRERSQRVTGGGLPGLRQQGAGSTGGATGGRDR
jgi:HlyD family secretion protein